MQSPSLCCNNRSVSNGRVPVEQAALAAAAGTMAAGAPCLQHLQTLEGHTDRVWHLAWSPDGSSLASCSGDRTVRIWQRSQRAGKGWRCAALLEDTHTKSIRCCCWSPGGTHLATASFDGTTAIWRLQAGVWEEVAKLEGHENEVKGAAWSPCGNFLATCGRDKTVWVWEALPGDEFDCLDVKHGHGGDVKALSWHPARELLASCSYDDAIKLWANDGTEWLCVATMEGPAVGHTSTVWSVAFSPDGHCLASVSDDCTLRLWQLAWVRGSSEPRVSLAACISGYHERTIFSVDWSPGGLIATGDGSNAIKVFAQSTEAEPGSTALRHLQQPPGTPDPAPPTDEQQQQQQQQQQDGEGDAAGAAAAAGGPWECLCSVVQAHTADINCVRWRPSQPDMLASAGDDGVIKLWRLERPSNGGADAVAAAGDAAGGGASSAADAVDA